ncbi:MAG: hypothetical protein ACLGIA_11265 [Actinomycetes bacterium]
MDQHLTGVVRSLGLVGLAGDRIDVIGRQAVRLLGHLTKSGRTLTIEAQRHVLALEPGDLIAQLRRLAPIPAATQQTSKSHGSPSSFQRLPCMPDSNRRAADRANLLHNHRVARPDD